MPKPNTICLMHVVIYCFRDYWGFDIPSNAHNIGTRKLSLSEVRWLASKWLEPECELRSDFKVHAFFIIPKCLCPSWWFYARGRPVGIPLSSHFCERWLIISGQLFDHGFIRKMLSVFSELDLWPVSAPCNLVLRIIYFFLAVTS